MMAPAQATSPREFGAALRSAREKVGVSIDVITDRTKIARRVLELLEAGEFDKLPNRVFVRLFLQQYLAIIGERAQDWIPTFEAAWQRFEDASQPWEIAAPAPTPAARLLPWLIGLAVVVGGLIAVVLVERQNNGENAPAAAGSPEILQPTPLLPTPSPGVLQEPAPEAEALAQIAAPRAPAPAEVLAAHPSPTTSAPLEAGTLVLRAGIRSCWVSVHVNGERSESRLMPPGTEWRLPANGRVVSLVVGDGGALAIEYLGEHREPAGADGEVVHLQLGPAPGSAEPKP